MRRQLGSFINVPPGLVLEDDVAPVAQLLRCSRCGGLTATATSGGAAEEERLSAALRDGVGEGKRSKVGFLLRRRLAGISR
jgi:hypothetical protein